MRSPDSPSPRLRAIVEALPLRAGLRVLEIGCGPGAAARAVADVIGHGHVLAIDRSPKAVAAAEAACRDQIASGRMAIRCVAGEDFVLAPGEAPFDLVFAVRVGGLDGRHPQVGSRILARIAAATTPAARMFIDGRERPIPRR